MRKLFVSYSHEDFDFAQHLASDLRREDLVVWIDAEHMKVGDSIARGLSEGLFRHDYFVPILSPDYVQSSWCEREMNVAIDLEIRKSGSILPALLRDCQIPQLISDKIYADFRVNYDSGYVALVAAISDAKKTRSTLTLPADLVIGSLEYRHLCTATLRTTNELDEDIIHRITITRGMGDKGRGQDFFIEFDITNSAQSDLRITGIDIEVEKCRPLERITGAGFILGVSSARAFFGEFRKEIGAYPLQFSIPHGYVKLAQREMEVIHLTINTPDEGIYDLKAVIRYSVAGRRQSISTPTIRNLWFVSPDTHHAAEGM